MDDHEWHAFDVEKGYEVRTVFGLIEVRQHGVYKATLTPEQFNQLRKEGANPEGLQ